MYSWINDAKSFSSARHQYYSRLDTNTILDSGVNDFIDDSLFLLPGLPPFVMDKLKMYAISNSGASGRSKNKKPMGITGNSYGAATSGDVVPPPRFLSILWDRKISTQIDKLSRLSTISGISSWLQKRSATITRPTLETSKVARDLQCKSIETHYKYSHPRIPTDCAVYSLSVRYRRRII